MKKEILKFGMIAIFALTSTLALNSCGGAEAKAEKEATEKKCEDGKAAEAKCEGTEKKCEGTEKKCEAAAEKKCEGAEKKCEAAKCEEGKK